MYRLSIILSLLVSGQALATEIDAYKCSISFSSQLQDNGETIESSYSKLFINKEFVVDKGTGRIKGDIKNHDVTGSPKVLDYGSDKQAFKAITVYQPNTAVQYIYIQEFNKNKEKPFMFIESNIIYSGLCTPY